MRLSYFVTNLNCTGAKKGRNIQGETQLLALTGMPDLVTGPFIMESRGEGVAQRHLSTK